MFFAAKYHQLEGGDRGHRLCVCAWVGDEVTVCHDVKLVRLEESVERNMKECAHVQKHVLLCQWNITGLS